MRIVRIAFALISVVLCAAGCGTRGVPAITQAQLDAKLSVLVVTPVGLSDTAGQEIAAALQDWRKEHQIAFEWLPNVTAWDQTLENKLHTRTYDYIYVIGNDLLPAAAQSAESDTAKRKWTLLQDKLTGSGSLPAATDKTEVLRIDPQQIDRLKSDWVLNLLAQHLSVEWVTTAAYPIPSQWAPSEEADHVVLLDNNPEWLNQIAFQKNQHGSAWIVFYAPVDAATVSKARTLGASVMDLSGALSAELNWKEVLAERLDAMLQHTWHGGEAAYSAKELKQLTFQSP
ncbi:hypothetical protein B5M42_002710 [Paenibacillus athensensis]|uniref:Lipoprotein n=1 Tax=Paenibacillus athensensis TaxID=1967502 RepID=A0A4Y8QA93_9BACL|nr:hypothetical protein [Paenibacillus athensensis]MCD1257751.1 hypothetical protein [Paenibacillus athensensis]